jgi:hypothetical protein
MRLPSASLLATIPLLALAACSSGAASTAGTGGDTTTSTSTGAGGHAPTATPFSAPDGVWTWIPLDDTHCADGSTTGVGVNFSKTGSRVMIYLEGGGACWDELTCYNLMTASYFTGGYGEAQFTTESTDAAYLAEPGGFFDRTAADNPFKDYSFVYVPYCTGDIHAGNHVATYGTHTGHHVGFANMTAILAHAAATFPGADRVLLAGSSAGGFGATYNWWQAQQAFGKIRVDLLDDSGTAMPADVMVQFEDEQRTNWDLASTLPPGCTDCLQHLDGLIPFYAKTFPDHRGALLSYTQDSVLPTFFGIQTSQFTAGLEELTSKDFDPTPNLKYFLVNASGHVLLFSPTLATNGVTLKQFVTEMVTDQKDWASVHP